MAMHRPFRFGTGAIPAASRADWIAHARKVEALGYASIGMGEHPGFGHLSAIPGMVAIADATSTLRLSCLFANDLTTRFCSPRRPRRSISSPMGAWNSASAAAGSPEITRPAAFRSTRPPSASDAWRRRSP